jgi:hypothetical protein
MFLQRFLILLMLWVLSLITTNVIAAPTFGASPTAGSMIKFSSTESGGAVSQTIRITNNGVDPLEITSAVFGLTNPSNFTFSGATGAFPLTIPTGSSSSLTITCTPDLTSYLTYANLGLTTNDPAKPNVSYTLACTRNSTGVIYESYPPKNSDINSFGDVDIGASKTRSVVIFNTGDTAMSISSLSFSGIDASNFNIALSPTSPLNGGSNTYLVINCSPKKVGLLQANLNVTTNASNVSSITYGLTCNGVGNSAPTDIILDNQSVNAGSAIGTVVGNLSTVDPDATNTHTYSVPATSGFTIQNNKLVTSQAIPSVSTATSYNVTIRSDDNAGGSFSKTFSISILPILNRAPTDIILDNQSVNGGSARGTVIGNLSTIDPDTTDTHTYSVPSTSVFAIQNNKLVTSQTIPLATTAPYSITIISMDNAGSSFKKTFNINVIPKVGALLKSNPPPNSLIDLGKTLVLTPTLGQTNTGQLEIIEAGDMDFKVSSNVTGTHAADFKVSPVSMFFPDGSSSQFLTIECTPSAKGIRSAQLQLFTDIANTPTAFTYPLQCEGMEGASFTSNPPFNQKWILGKILVGQTISRPLQIIKAGDMALKLTPTLKGINVGDFKVLPNSPIIADGVLPAEFKVECIPSEKGIRTAILELATNDLKNPLVSYPLECEGSDTVISNPISSVPPIGEKIVVGKTSINQPVNSFLEITETGTIPLNIIAVIKGLNAQDFKISPTSMFLDDGSNPQKFAIECRPQAQGIRNAILELHFNSTLLSNSTTSSTMFPPISYPLECEGTPPAMFNSNPPAGSMIFFNSDSQGTPVSKVIQITNLSNQLLTINSLDIQGGAYANSFSQFGGFPMNIAPQSSSSLSLLCKPETELLQGGFLHLTTNDPENPEVTYGLACLKRTTGAIYVSLPRVNESIYFNNVMDNRPEIRSLFILNAGDTPFSISEMNFTGTNPDIFRIVNISSFPMSISGGDIKKVDIECNPTQEGIFSADLNVLNDAAIARRNVLTTTYPLICRKGVNNPPTDILLSNEKISPETPANTLIADISTLDLDINDRQIYSLQDSSGLFVVKGRQLFTAKNIPIGSTGFDIVLKSVDSGGLFIEKKFHLTVDNLFNQFKAEIVTSEGVKSLVDETELITAKGYIRPLPEEVGKIGDVFVVYQYTSLSNGVAKLPITLLQNVPLQANIELLLYQGRLIYLPGKFDIILGYRINGNENKELATTFSVRRNMPPSGFELSRNTLVERSSAGTVIGKFVAQDTNKNDFFRYLITKNAGLPFGYFRIVGDELQMTESFPLTFSENATLDIGVRVIDGAGGFLDKNFTIKVIENDVPHIGGEIRSNNYAIRGTKDQLATLMKDQLFTANAWIQPPSIHLRKTADILYKIVFTPISGEVQIFEGIWEKDRILSSAIDIEMAKDFSLNQAGTYEVSIGYRLKDGTFQVLTPFQKFRVQG